MIAVDDALLGATVAFALITLTVVYRLVRGPTMQDRVIALNVIGTNIVVVLALLAVVTDNPSALDIAIVYALLNFLTSIAVSKFTVERGGVL